MRTLGQHPIFVFGAGATKACGGPLTAEILPAAFSSPVREALVRKDLAEYVNDCLIQHFHVPTALEERRGEVYPPLPMLLSLLDLAIDQDRPLVFGDGTGRRLEHWDRERLAAARSAVEYLIFAVLNEHLRTVTRNWYEDLFARLGDYPKPRVISLNYDILLDNVLFQIAADRGGPDARLGYACDIRTEAYRRRRKEYGRLFKLHGSLNWLYCACCRRLDLGMSESGRTCKVLNELYDHQSLDKYYTGRAAVCPECQTPLRAVMITPTRAKDYRNPHIQAIWYQAERSLRKSDHVVFIGYSLPDDDIEVIDLLRRGLGHLSGDAVTVVEYDPEQRALADHPVGRRYRSLFGGSIDWQTVGFGRWVESASGTSA
jgi:hypothetical protein